MIKKELILSVLSLFLPIFCIGGAFLIGESAEKETVPTTEYRVNISHLEYTRLLNALGAYQEIQKQGGWQSQDGFITCCF